ncbi:MAG: sigma-70 family RNA polymerase sigma factor [Polyangiaceae bacterium]
MSDEAFRKVLEAHRGSLTRLASSFARTKEDRQDLLQEMTLALWNALRSFRGECSERTFVFRVAHNVGMKSALKRRMDRARTESASFEASDPDADPETIIVREQRVRGVSEAVAALPGSMRQVVVLALEGLSYSEISDVLGIQPEAVGARLSRARTVMRSMLREERSSR